MLDEIIFYLSLFFFKMERESILESEADVYNVFKHTRLICHNMSWVCSLWRFPSRFNFNRGEFQRIKLNRELFLTD